MLPNSASIPPENRSSDSRSRHSRKCSVCRHPQRAAIDHDFIHWYSPSKIVRDFGLYNRRTLYRHAHATGLFHRRGARLASMLEGILECGSTLTATPYSLIRAVEVYSKMRDPRPDPLRAKEFIRKGVTHSASKAPLGSETSRDSNSHAARSRNVASHVRSGR